MKNNDNINVGDLFIRKCKSIDNQYPKLGYVSGIKVERKTKPFWPIDIVWIWDSGRIETIPYSYSHIYGLMQSYQYISIE